MGTMLCGWTVKTLQDSHWSAVDTYRLVFWAYAAIGVLKSILSLMLSERSERNAPNKDVTVQRETEPLLGHNPNKNSLQSAAAVPISRATRRFLLKLSLILVLDSFGIGLAFNAWTMYFVKTKFHVDHGILGSIFSSSDILQLLSNVLAIPSVKRIGLIKSILLGRVLSSATLILFPFPSTIAGIAAVLLARAVFLDFHQPARQTFISQSVLPEERTAVMGVLNVVMTVAQSPGPAMTGELAQHGLLWFSGGIKLVYNLLLFLL